MARNPGLNKAIVEDLKTELEGMVFGGGDGATNLGDVYFVDSTHANASDNNAGTDPARPLATIDAGIGKCTASSGDIVMVAPGHAETVTSAITVDVVGISIIGQGNGLNRPYISCATDSIDEMTITAANCLISNLGFNEATGTTARASFINVAAANTVIRGCQFDMGQYDTEGITVEAAGNNLLIEDCVWSVTADGPDAAIEIEGASSNLRIINCEFDGGSDTNAWDAAAINSTAACLGVYIDGCRFRFCLTAQEFITFTAVTEPVVITENNSFYSGAALASDLNPPKTIYVDSTKGTDVSGCGFSPHVPCATLDHAVGLCSADAGDIIMLAPNHTETITTAAPCAVDIAGVSIIGVGNGTNRPTISLGTNVGATVTISAADVHIKNVLFSNIVDNCTSMLTISGADCTLEDCETRDTGSVEAALVATITGDRCTLKNFVHVGEGSGDQAVACLQVTGTDRFKMDGFNIKSMGSTALFSSLTTANTNLEIRNGYFTQQETAVGVAVSLLAGCSGWIGPNVHIRLTDADTDPWAAIDSASNVNFVGPITVCNGDDEAGVDIASGYAVEADQAVVMTPYGAARVVTEAFQPAASLVPIFTPTVGKSLIVGLYCEIVTEIGAASDWRVQYTTTAADAINLTALTQMDALKVETWMGVTGDYLDLLSPGVARLKTPILVDGGHTGASIGVLGSEANAAVGAGTWYCVYVPLERGALITAAA